MQIEVYHSEKSSFFECSLMRSAAFAKSLAALAVFAAAVASSPARADMVALDGSWSGGGSVTFPSGAKESARCRANFKKRGAESYLVSARCASASGKVEQSALLTYVG